MVVGPKRPNPAVNTGTAPQLIVVVVWLRCGFWPRNGPAIYSGASAAQSGAENPGSQKPATQLRFTPIFPKYCGVKTSSHISLYDFETSINFSIWKVAHSTTPPG